MWEHRQTAGNTQTWAVPAGELGPVIHALLFGCTKVGAPPQKGRSAKKWGPRQRLPGRGEGQVGRPGRWSEGGWLALRGSLGGQLGENEVLGG